MRSSVRGGSKVGRARGRGPRCGAHRAPERPSAPCAPAQCVVARSVKGTRRRRRRRAEHEPPPPSGDGGTGLSVWSLPLPARPLACGQSPGPGPLGRGRSLWCMCAAAGPPSVAPSGRASRRCGAASAGSVCNGVVVAPSVAAGAATLTVSVRAAAAGRAARSSPRGWPSRHSRARAAGRRRRAEQLLG